MQIFITNQYGFLLYSLISGLFIGLVYDICVILPTLLLRKKTPPFLLDFVFILLWGFIMLLITFDKNGGIYRSYSVLATLISFSIYRKTVGKITKKLLTVILNAFFFINNYILTKIKNTIDIFIKFVKIKLKKLYIKRYVNRIIKDAYSGFERKEKYEKYNRKKFKEKIELLV